MLKRGASRLSERQGSALEGLAFDWIVNSERYIEPKFTELTKCCGMVHKLQSGPAAPVLQNSGLWPPST